MIGRFAGAFRRTLTWSPDSRYVFLQGKLEETETAQLLLLSVEDGSLRSLGETPGGVSNISVSPDGRHVSMETGERRQEIWRMTFNN